MGRTQLERKQLQRRKRDLGQRSVRVLGALSGHKETAGKRTQTLRGRGGSSLESAKLTRKRQERERDRSSLGKTRGQGGGVSSETDNKHQGKGKMKGRLENQTGLAPCYKNEGKMVKIRGDARDISYGVKANQGTVGKGAKTSRGLQLSLMTKKITGPGKAFQLKAMKGSQELITEDKMTGSKAGMEGKTENN